MDHMKHVHAGTCKIIDCCFLDLIRLLLVNWYQGPLKRLNVIISLQARVRRHAYGHIKKKYSPQNLYVLLYVHMLFDIYKNIICIKI